MHGEYKVPGGKLVVVDLEVSGPHELSAGGVLRDVRVSGDFFLEPDDALEAIDAALEGVPADTEAADLAARVRAALPPGAVLVGVTPEAVAVVVRRALARATGFADHSWSLVHRGPESPELLMALDEVLLEEVAHGRRGPTLRVWEWDRPTVIIGSFQSLRNEVDGEAASALGVDVVRRISGGGAMFAEPGNTITWSLTVPDSMVAGLSFVDSYAYLDAWVLEALGDLGVRAEYRPINDIVSAAGKIAGAAQKRVPGAVLHHVTMSYDIDAAKMLQVLRIGREKLSDKGTTSAAKRVDPLRSQTGMAREDVIAAMAASFRARYGLADGDVTPAELASARELAQSKYLDPAWTARVP
ncbi:lipoate--protein ligase family protein [Streptomyces sp. NP160]|uniref:lipoate--protein ligase family protein n=1 Tax=Streptomyces sp. NP160 TaxID=2586637 RepID=UPI00111BAF06|nr:biotin/lipoate A/B protein ligase family protein [Streptomyces sp. NP160]TNM69851.1 lipoate--protein ligase family protein [Streptomyces sp. NP160]